MEVALGLPGCGLRTANTPDWNFPTYFTPLLLLKIAGSTFVWDQSKMVSRSSNPSGGERESRNTIKGVPPIMSQQGLNLVNSKDMEQPKMISTTLP
jgi:hypothetical protein